MTSDSKYVYLSYDDADKEIALQLQEVLETTLIGEIWIRHLDLRAGDLVADVLSDAISEVKWFILILTHNSLNSEWIRKELRLLTIRWLEGMNFNLIVIRADDCNLPRDLKIAMESHYVLNLHDVEDKQDEFVRLSIYIEEKNVARPERKVFVDRGKEVDQFIYSAKYHPIVFVLGTAGIGKTSLVLNKFGPQLRKQPIEVSFSRGKGDSIDYLMREILRKTHVKQPMDSNHLKDTELISLAVEAIKKRERRYFLFVDNLEYALTASHELLLTLYD